MGPCGCIVAYLLLGGACSLCCLQREATLCCAVQAAPTVVYAHDPHICACRPTGAYEPRLGSGQMWAICVIVMC
jgi:hypothetical protein